GATCSVVLAARPAGRPIASRFAATARSTVAAGISARSTVAAFAGCAVTTEAAASVAPIAPIAAIATIASVAATEAALAGTAVTRAATATAPARGARSDLAFQLRTDEVDLAAIVDVVDLDLQLVAFLEVVLDALDALLGDLADVKQAIGAGEDV